MTMFKWLRAASLAFVAAACAPSPHSAQPVTLLRVMTYNIRSGNGDLARTADVIRAQSPDIAALQEVDVHWADRSAFADQTTELASRLGLQARFAGIYRLPGAPGAPLREFGVALLTRLPVVSFHNDTITRLSTQEANPVPAPMPGLLDAELDVHGTRVRVFVTHLDYRRDPSVRARQVADMLRFIRSSSMPTLLLGDLNASPDAPELQPLLGRLHDVWDASPGPGFTYPADVPRERIDYVLASPAFRVRDVRVVDTQASDHRPVVADLTLP
jgi:endonuclease/exonuclease/phosphatase family metal-dependent hydrolase